MRLLRTLSALAVASVCVATALIAATPASATTIDGVITSSSTNVSGYYPTSFAGACYPNNYPNVVANLVTVTPTASGDATFAITAATFDSGMILAVYRGSYDAAHCIAVSEKDLVGGGKPLPSVTVPLEAGQDYIVFVFGCNGDCMIASEFWGSYTLDYELPVDRGAAGHPAWLQAYGHDRDAACTDGWSPSWQEWAQSVSGGWVCTRTVDSLG